MMESLTSFNEVLHWQGKLHACKTGAEVEAVYEDWRQLLMRRQGEREGRKADEAAGLVAMSQRPQPAPPVRLVPPAPATMTCLAPVWRGW